MNSCYIIAEAGLNHNGSIEIAKKLIDIAADSGADAVKFQKRTVSKLAIPDTLNAKDDRFPSFGKTYREIRNFLEFDKKEYKILKSYADNKQIDFIVTAFDIEAYNFLIDIGVEKFKFASHSLTNIDLLNHAANNRKTSILSTGMSDLLEIDTAVEIFKTKNCPLSLLHCVSSYPTPHSDCNIAFMNKLKERYNLQVGYSGHEIGYLPTLVAVSNGAKIIERHYTLDKSMEGFDHKISLEPNELKEMIKSIREIISIYGKGEKNISDTEMITRNKYHVSMVSKIKIKKGLKLQKEFITYKNPGTGIPPKFEEKYINKIFSKDVEKDTLISEDMFENE